MDNNCQKCHKPFDNNDGRKFCPNCINNIKNVMKAAGYLDPTNSVEDKEDPAVNNVNPNMEERPYPNRNEWTWSEFKNRK
jgi:uncharacterized Zn finger protein (UPF0148 family)